MSAKIDARLREASHDLHRDRVEFRETADELLGFSWYIHATTAKAPMSQLVIG